MSHHGDTDIKTTHTGKKDVCQYRTGKKKHSLKYLRGREVIFP